MSTGQWWMALALALAGAGCTPALPDPQSEGAHMYAARCSACHRLYMPGSMTAEMWRIQVERMQGEMVRRGLPPLTEAERASVLDYLQRHSG